MSERRNLDHKRGINRLSLLSYVRPDQYPKSVPKKIDPESAEKVMLKGGWRPLEPYKNALAPWKCECIKCGHIGTPQFSNVQRGSGCTLCKNSEKEKPTKISDEKAERIMRQAGMKPLEPYVNSKTPWKSKCTVCKKITSPALGNVIQGHKACAYCSGHKVDPKDAIKVMKKAKLEPLELFTSVDAAWKCKCLKCGKIVKPAYSSVRSGQGGCVSCGREATAKSHRYTHEMTVDTMKQADLEPLEEYKSSDAPWKCRCLKCYRVVFPSFSNVSKGHKGCAYCSGNAVHPEDAVKIMLESGYEPLEPYPAHNKTKWKSRHIQCGTIVFPFYNTIQNRKSGCSVCAEYGLKLENPAYVYIMFHHEFNSIKVGISNNNAKPNRIKSHASDGWQLFKQIDVLNGAIATEIEAKTFNWIRRELGLGVHLSKEMMKHHGYSETVDANEVTVLQIERRIQEILSELEL
jgi:hypothetical protein